jgi:hypothetical protein
MKPNLSIAFSIMLITVIIVACNSAPARDEAADTTKAVSPTVIFGGFESQLKWGEHLVSSWRL